ncbi:hypothetical protein [Thiomicrorhabdus sp. Milos-T2]|uniref:hypothetical protein n=1 Tax=Thiomicrorhabdus sp. Milos-T2 TaxID=90814 RepID=UPI000493BFB6|nr:hypothetical protein [Thiomicrorhabdus sp. Milos-T2]
MEYIRSKSLFIFIMLGVLILLTFLLWQRYTAEVEQFSELQQTLIEQQAYQSAKDYKKTDQSLSKPNDGSKLRCNLVKKFVIISTDRVYSRSNA